MAEQNELSLQVEESIALTPVTAETDWFLQNLVSFANDWGLEMGVTLQVSGMLVSGTLISGVKYFEEFAAQFSGGIKNSSELSEQFHQLISSYKEVYDVETTEMNNRLPPNYIHLRNAKFYQPGQKPFPTDHGVLWRGRVSEVGGFNLGSFSGS